MEGVIGAAVGVVGAWVATSIGFHYKESKAKKHIYQEVLFNLLENWHHLCYAFELNPDKLSVLFVERCKLEFGADNISKEEEDNFLKEIYEAMRTHASRLALHEDDGASKSFKDSIQKLSSINGLLAFELNGKQSLKKILGAYDQLLNDHNKNQDGQLDRDFKVLYDSYFQGIFDDAMRNLEKDILKVANNISILTSIKTKLRIWKLKRKRSSVASDVIDPLIADMKKTAIKHQG